MSTPAPTKAVDKATPNQPAAPEGEGETKRGWLSWIVGWVLVPGAVIGLIFGGGVVLGAHRPEGWFARTVVWVVELF